MNVLSILFIYTFGAVLLGGAIAMAYVAMHNRTEGLRFRQCLVEDVNSLRLSTMLAYRGISLTHYIARERVLDIRKHIFNCEHCADLEICDEVLRHERDPGEDFSFCPNRKALVAIRAKQLEAHL